METFHLNQRLSDTQKAKLIWVALVILISGAAIMLRLFNPVRSWIFPPCPFRAITGWKCPGCGTLRGLHQLLQGNLYAAWQLNPLMLLMLPFLGYAFIAYTWKVFKGKPLLKIYFSARQTWLLLIIILVYWVARNIF